MVGWGEIKMAAAATAVLCALAAWPAQGQAPAQSRTDSVVPNDLPNPYRVVTGWAQLPDGRKWGSTAGVTVGPDDTIWAYDRCGANSCADSNLDPILHFDQSGKLLGKFGAGLFVFPHGLAVDGEGNVWVTDAQGSKDGTKGHQVFKFSPTGKLLMRLGKAGVAGDGPDLFNQPAAVAVAKNGDIFIADGHVPSYGNARIVKFSKDGKFIKSWGHKGSAPGEFLGAHCLAIDSTGRLFVGDRSNNRIQIFDQEGKFLAEWKQFGRPSGLFIDRHDRLYVTDSESTDRFVPDGTNGAGYGYNPGVKRGIRIGSARDGKVVAFIPDLDPKGGSSTAEGVAVDSHGNVYGAEVGPKDLKKYVPDRRAAHETIRGVGSKATLSDEVLANR